VYVKSALAGSHFLRDLQISAARRVTSHRGEFHNDRQSSARVLLNACAAVPSPKLSNDRHLRGLPSSIGDSHGIAIAGDPGQITGAAHYRVRGDGWLLASTFVNFIQLPVRRRSCTRP
jgi:hypothetical protein